MIDSASILNPYQKLFGQDAVFDKLFQMWNSVEGSSDATQEGKRLAVLAGIIAHLQLNRYLDLTESSSKFSQPSLACSSSRIRHALAESRRLGSFLDAMPLLPQHTITSHHPFPTHFLYWDDDEIEILLRGTMAQTKAREVRAGVGLVIREWSNSFMKEHSQKFSQTQILNAVLSAFTAVLSRSFGDSAGRDLGGKGRMLVPLVDMLNHDGGSPNVNWKWHVKSEDYEKIADGRGEIVVKTLCDIQKGDELFKCYGWRPAWDIAASYGFVPHLNMQHWECTVLPLFPAVLDFAPDVISSPSDKGRRIGALDLLLESNYGPLVRAIVGAVEAFKLKESETKACKSGKVDPLDDICFDCPEQLKRFEVISLFCPPPQQFADEHPFLRRQPCIIVGTKTGNLKERNAINFIMPAFRAAASAISQLSFNHQNGLTNPIDESQIFAAASSLGNNMKWDEQALKLISTSIDDRIETISKHGKIAESWLASIADTNETSNRMYRAEVAKNVRDAELRVLQTLKEETSAKMHSHTFK